eukprot:732962_1
MPKKSYISRISMKTNVPNELPWFDLPSPGAYHSEASTNGHYPFRSEKPNFVTLSPSIYAIPILIPFSNPQEKYNFAHQKNAPFCDWFLRPCVTNIVVLQSFFLLLLNFLVQGGFVWYIGVVLESLNDQTCGSESATFLKLIAIFLYSALFVEDLYDSASIGAWLYNFPISREHEELRVRDDLDIARELADCAESVRSQSEQPLSSVDALSEKVAKVPFARSSFIINLLKSIGWSNQQKRFRAPPNDSKSKLITVSNFAAIIEEAREDLVGNPELNEERIVSGMRSGFKWFMFAVVIFPKMAIALFLSSYGGGFILSSKDNANLILNTLAVTFIIDIDETLFNLFVPNNVKRVIEEIPPVRVNMKPQGKLQFAASIAGPSAKILGTFFVSATLYFTYC